MAGQQRSTPVSVCISNSKIESGLEPVPLPVRYESYAFGHAPAMSDYSTPGCSPAPAGLELAQRRLNDPPKKKIFGFERTVFILSTIIVFLLVLIIAGGTVGGVVAQRKINSSYSSAASHTTRTVTITVTTASSSAIPTTFLNGVSVECPGADNTLYTPPNSSQVFARQCNTDYPSNSDAHVELNGYSDETTMEDCINLCARWNVQRPTADRCWGVSWSYMGPQGTGVNSCWLKNGTLYMNLKKTPRPYTESAILISDP